MYDIFKKYITLNYLFYIFCDVIYVLVFFTKLIEVSHHQWLVFFYWFNSFSLIIFLQLYKGEVFMTCFMTWYFDQTLVSLIVQHWWQTMLILYQVIETWLNAPKEFILCTSSIWFHVNDTLYYARSKIIL